MRALCREIVVGGFSYPDFSYPYDFAYEGGAMLWFDGEDFAATYAEENFYSQSFIEAKERYKEMIDAFVS
jgi:hypothetical protein